MKADFSEIARYLGGDLSRLEERQIESRIKNDKEFAAQVEIGRMIVGHWKDDLEGEGPRVDRNGPLSRKWGSMAVKGLIIVSAVILISATVYAANVLFDSTIFYDSFRSKTFDRSRWKTPPDIIVNQGGGVRPEAGFVRLVNRGYLQPDRTFPAKISIEFEWQWNWLGLDPLYSDHLTVALRTNAIPNPDFFYEVSDGIVIKFDASTHAVSISGADGNQMEITEGSTVRMPHDEWHNIKITDDGNIVSVFIDGPEIVNKHHNKPVVTLRKARTSSDGFGIVVYNRELQQFPHESCIRSFRVRTLE